MGAADAGAARDQEDLQRTQGLYKSGAATAQVRDHAVAAARVSQAGLEAARKKAAAAQAQVAAAQAAARVAEGNVLSAQSQAAEAQSAVAQSQARLAAAQAGPQQVAVSEAQARVAAAQVDEAAAAVDQSKLQLSYTTVPAPIAGRVTHKAVEPGAYVQVGQSLLALVPDDIWVVANFKETDLSSIQPGQPVDVRVDVYPGKTFKGRVDSVQAGSGAAFSLLPPENATGYFIKVVQRVPVKIVFDEPLDLNVYHLGPGMSVVPTVSVFGRPTPARLPPEPAAPATAKAPRA